MMTGWLRGLGLRVARSNAPATATVSDPPGQPDPQAQPQDVPNATVDSLAPALVSDPPPLPAVGPIVGGKRLASPAVVTWRDPRGFSFYDGGGWVQGPRPRKVDLGVLHWSVTATAAECFRVLRQRGLSVHFMIDADGTIYQALDVADTAWHASGVNDRSWGVEIAGGLPPKTAAEGVALDVRGDRSLFAPFGNEQVRAVVSLAGALSDHLGIPRQLPAAPASSPWQRDDGVVRDVDPRIVQGSFAGTCGHHHADSRKIDPGASLWAPLRAAGFEVA